MVICLFYLLPTISLPIVRGRRLIYVLEVDFIVVTQELFCLRLHWEVSVSSLIYHAVFAGPGDVLIQAAFPSLLSLPIVLLYGVHLFFGGGFFDRTSLPPYLPRWSIPYLPVPTA
jgi:hypothetical protein